MKNLVLGKDILNRPSFKLVCVLWDAMQYFYGTFKDCLFSGFVIGVVLDINSNAETPSDIVYSRSLANNFRLAQSLFRINRKYLTFQTVSRY